MASLSGAGESQIYPYDVLNRGKWIRLLRLLPGRDDDTLSCELFSADIHSNFKYSAISYVWGDATKKAAILCNGYNFGITYNLRDALKHIRHETDERVVWADAICIDQTNKAERARQVTLMSEIYEQAQEVLVWLGNDDQGDAQVAVDTILEINRYFDTAVAQSGSQEDIPDIEESNALLDESRWHAMFHFLDKQWFTRVWVIQEVGLAASATVLYGPTSIPFSEIIQFVLTVDRRLDLNSVPFTLPIGLIIDAFNLIWRSYGNARSWREELRHIAQPGEDFSESNFFNILLAGSWLGATDPRDRVYAFLGHPAAKRGREKKTIVEPDYDASKEEMFTKLTIELLSQQDSLVALSAVRHSEKTLDGSMPSWVERWDQSSEVVIIGSLVDTVKRPFDADLHRETGAEYKADIIIPDDTKKITEARLNVRVILIDIIDDVSEVMDEEDLEKYTQSAGDSIDLLNLLDMLQATILKDTNLDTENIDAFSQALCAGLLDLDCAAEDDITQHRADFNAFVKERCGKHLVSLCASRPSEASQEGVTHYYSVAAGRFCHGRKFFVTKQGRFGIGPAALKKGHICATVFGARLPFALARSGSPEESTFLLLGEVYLHGMMRGDAVKMWKCRDLSIEEISLI
ncbi:hypothetical protein OIDMADRAFT_60396 [Oidiodendron maius Zn]|uniref:Heterokaryon incompatibility domain-containing protein n=1 Tax=Oidiodendron maius (strain Zn) TaxID=913774 RepID=A0A0C3GES7_OIDMZ|nr:hypothetical protein OIDMADRAFT_60396 [Oidiodendron maius Zn]